jgi:hypothetical protein
VGSEEPNHIQETSQPFEQKGLSLAVSCHRGPRASGAVTSAVASFGVRFGVARIAWFPVKRLRPALDRAIDTGRASCASARRGAAEARGWGALLDVDGRREDRQGFGKPPCRIPADGGCTSPRSRCRITLKSPTFSASLDCRKSPHRIAGSERESSAPRSEEITHHRSQ